MYTHEVSELPEAERNTANGASAEHEIQVTTDFEPTFASLMKKLVFDCVSFFHRDESDEKMAEIGWKARNKIGPNLHS